MKKYLSILFVFSLLFLLTACSSSAAPSQESSGQTTSQPQVHLLSKIAFQCLMQF